MIQDVKEKFKKDRNPEENKSTILEFKKKKIVCQIKKIYWKSQEHNGLGRDRLYELKAR